MNSGTSASGKDKPQNTFEIGLCMAGAISAGAYTAGVVDFLVEALEAWQQAKNDDKAAGKRTVLSHDVVITCMAGASAGGMTAAAVTAGLCGTYEPINKLVFGEKPRQTNIPYTCWVESVDIDDLLGVRDLESSPVVRSLLDCTILDDVAGRFMKPDGSEAKHRPYIAREMELYLTLANLRGTPYTVRFRGPTGYGHEMIQHQDHIRFRLTRSGGEVGGEACSHFLERIPLRSGVTGDSVNWRDFRLSALATGAFPLALLPRVLERERKEYRDRAWFIPRKLDCVGPCLDEELDNEPYHGPVFHMSKEYLASGKSPGKLELGELESFETLNVDGGTFDNEPLELARRHLAGDAMVNPRKAAEANRAVLLIDPFPHEEPKTQSENYAGMDVLTVAGKILGALKANARFKPEELVLAQNPDCYSRFLIGPSRKKGAGNEWQTDIACGSLGGFGGFFSRKFRQHDYMLGRRNCQWFLYQHFVIPLNDALENAVFTAADRNNLTSFAYEVTDENGKKGMVVPIIPLMPEVHPDQGGEADVPAWEQVQISAAEVDRLRPAIIKRLTRVVDMYLKQYVGGFTGKLVKWFFLNRKLEELADALLSKIHTDFKNAGVEK